MTSPGRRRVSELFDVGIELHWGCRVAARCWMLIHPAGALRHRHGVRLAAALLALDVYQARQLRSHRFDSSRGKALQIVLDTADAAVTTALAPSTALAAQACGGVQVVSAPLAAVTAYEAGAVRSLAAVLPATAAVGVVRALRREPLNLVDLVTWPVWTATLGTMLAATEQAQIRRRSAREEERRSAAGEQGFLSGRRAWVRAHLALLDRLENFGLNILGVPGVELATAQELDSLAKRVRVVARPEPGRPAFLAALLQQYERDQALTHRIEERLALAELSPEDGQLLLTGHQSRLLWDGLAVLRVAGELRVEVQDRISRGLDTEATLHLSYSRTLDGGPGGGAILTLPTGSPSWRVEFVTLVERRVQ